MDTFPLAPARTWSRPCETSRPRLPPASGKNPSDRMGGWPGPPRFFWPKSDSGPQAPATNWPRPPGPYPPPALSGFRAPPPGKPWARSAVAPAYWPGGQPHVAVPPGSAVPLAAIPPVHQCEPTLPPPLFPSRPCRPARHVALPSFVKVFFFRPPEMTAFVPAKENKQRPPNGPPRSGSPHAGAPAPLFFPPAPHVLAGGFWTTPSRARTHPLGALASPPVYHGFLLPCPGVFGTFFYPSPNIEGPRRNLGPGPPPRCRGSRWCLLFFPPESLTRRSRVNHNTCRPAILGWSNRCRCARSPRKQSPTAPPARKFRHTHLCDQSGVVSPAGRKRTQQTLHKGPTWSDRGR